MRAIAAYLAEIAARLDARLGGRLVGAWLVGSGALGDFDPLRSDVDVQAASTTRLSRNELRGVATALSHEVLPCPGRGLEFVLYARDGLCDPQGPAFQLNLNTGRAMRHHEGYVPGAEPRFWFVLDVAIARQHARPLTGQHPQAILPALSRPMVLAALADALAWYRSQEDHAQAVLAACRAWAWAVDERWLSKGDAAAWAASRLADSAPVGKALAARSDPATPGPTRAEATAFLDRVQRLLAPAHRQMSGRGGQLT
jgi:hypothetical protein